MSRLWPALLPLTLAWQPPSTWIGVNSAPEHAAQRAAIRESWMRDAWVRRDGEVRFVIGRSSKLSVDLAVSQESHRYGDILHVDLDEEYRQLPLKTLLLLQAGAKSGARWIMKIDDDVVPRMSSIEDTILTTNVLFPEPSLVYVGKFWESENTHVSRNPNDKKYYVPWDVYPKRHFPKFANGPLYMMSQTLARSIAVDGFNETLRNPIPLEDVNIGRAVSRLDGVKANVEYVDLTLGIYGRKVLVYGCRRGVQSQYYHGISPSDMKCMWRKIELGAYDVCCGEEAEQPQRQEVNASADSLKTIFDGLIPGSTGAEHKVHKRRMLRHAASLAA